MTVTASDGRRTASTTATFVQVASASPMTTLAVRLEPTVVRVQDADNASVQVVLDNRQGRTGVRLFLESSDPERAVRGTFSPPVVDLAAGQISDRGAAPGRLAAAVRTGADPAVHGDGG